MTDLPAQLDAYLRRIEPNAAQRAILARAFWKTTYGKQAKANPETRHLFSYFEAGTLDVLHQMKGGA